MAARVASLGGAASTVQVASVGGPASSVVVAAADGDAGSGEAIVVIIERVKLLLLMLASIMKKRCPANCKLPLPAACLAQRQSVAISSL